MAKAAVAATAKAAFHHRWRRQDVDTIRQMRHRLQETAAAGDLKRGPGGIVDIEFLVQMLQLKHGRRCSEVRLPNTLEALAALVQEGCLPADDGEFFANGYRFLRGIEGRLRLMNSTARDRLPENPTELAKLAHLLHYESSQALLDHYRNVSQQIRRRFDKLFDAAGDSQA